MIEMREPGAVTTGPLVTLKARKVTLHQILELVKVSHPIVDVDQIQAEDENLHVWAFKVVADPKYPGPEVKVFRLTTALQFLSNKGNQKTAMEDLLSLLTGSRLSAGRAHFI